MRELKIRSSGAALVFGLLLVVLLTVAPAAANTSDLYQGENISDAGNSPVLPVGPDNLTAMGTDAAPPPGDVTPTFTDPAAGTDLAATAALQSGDGWYSGGSGTEGDPYRISTREDLITLSTDSGNWTCSFILTDNISLAAGSPTEPIGNQNNKFTGSFDGQGYTISGFTMSKGQWSYYVGLFGYLGSGAEIKNLGIETGADGVVGDSYVGVLAGGNMGTIINCSATGNATASNNYAGGLVGYNENGAIIDCYAAGNVNAYGYAGGLVGYNKKGTITGCHATASTTAETSYAGGLVGYNDYGTITNCYATGSVAVEGGSYAGGLAGYNYYGDIADSHATGSAAATYDYAAGLVGLNNDGTITNCYALGSATADKYAGGLAGYNSYGDITDSYATGSATAKSVSSDYGCAGGLVGLNNDGTIANCSASGNATASNNYAGGLVGHNCYGSGVITNCSASGNAAASQNYAGGLVGYNEEGAITNCYASGSATANREAGGLVGKNYFGSAITNCYAAGSATADIIHAGGLVGDSYSGNITNCHATGNASAKDEAGGLVGGYSGGTITNCSAAGSAAADNYAGGLAGYSGGDITSCYATGNATVSNNYAGGLVGENNNGIISRCYAEGSADAGVSYAGGLVGWNYGSVATLINCYAAGNATGEYYYVGGLVGYNYYGPVTNCYATGNATADQYAGGLVGYIWGDTITNCYATGNATANSYYGGLVGREYIQGSYVINSYRYSGSGDNSEGIRISNITTFKDYAFLTGTAAEEGLNWSTDIISTDVDRSKIWRAFADRSSYPVFQWQSLGSGNLQVNSVPQGAAIYLNGADTGFATNHEFLSLPAGSYNVRVILSGYEESGQEVTVEKGETSVVNFALIQGTGTLKVTSTPTGAKIYLDGANTGYTTDHEFTDLSVGTHSVTLALSGYETSSQEVTVEKDATTAVAFTLVKKAPAIFTASPTSGVAPLTVAFTDRSTISPTSWLWDFGDGNTSTVQNPTHTYAAVGNYTVSLSVNGGAAASTIPDCIEVTPVLYGDANNDGIVNQADTLRVLKEVVGISAEPEAGTKIFRQTDVNHNGAIDIGDALFIAQYNVGLRDAWFVLIK